MARKKCPKLKSYPPDYKSYKKMSDSMMSLIKSYSPDIEQMSIDECFLDVTDYLKMYKMTDEELGEKILKTIFEKTGLTATCGIGPNMLLAKIAMDIEAKHNPNNILISSIFK